MAINGHFVARHRERQLVCEGHPQRSPVKGHCLERASFVDNEFESDACRHFSASCGETTPTTKGWADARVGIGMGWGGGDSFNWK